VAITSRQASRALRALPATAKPAVQQVMDVTAYNVERGAETRVRRRTGYLAANIGWQSRPRSLSAVVGVSKGTVYYWKFVEYGTVKMDASPFLRPSAQAEEPRHAAALTQALERVASGMASGSAFSSRLL
jgi:HK97 gp10 family phage protein